MIRAATTRCRSKITCRKSLFLDASSVGVVRPNLPAVAVYSFTSVQHYLRYQSTSGNTRPEKKLPVSAEIVIAGAGAVGSSVAYHLAKLGWRDVLVLEQGQLSCGTSWHAAGTIGTMRSTKLLTSMGLYALELYSELEDETGLGTGFKRCGSLNVASTKEKATHIRRVAANSRQWGVEVEEITAKEALDYYPLMKTSDIEMAVWLPNDGVATSSDICQSLMKGATLKGVKFLEGVGVNYVASQGNRVTGVETSLGFVHCNVFINCSGLWARELGLRSSPAVNLPLHACEHFYIVTKPMEGVHNMLPVLRDGASHIYIREWSGGLMAGGFEPVAKPCFYKGIPEKFEFQLLPEDWDQFETLMQGALNRIPSIEKAEIRQFLNGPESFTPDGNLLFGEVPELRSYYVAAAMNSNGIVNAAAIGKMLSELVTFDSCSWDFSSIDIKRFTPGQNNKLYLQDRVKEVLGYHYKIPYPKEDLSSARCVKCSTLHGMLDHLGAKWSHICGWEKANWFARNQKEKMYTPSFGKPAWLPNVESEYRACKEGAGIADISWMSMFLIKSADDSTLTHTLQYIFSRDVRMNIGMSITTAILNPFGGYEGIVNLIKLDKTKYMVITPPSQHTHALSWISKHLPEDGSVLVHDITGRYAALAVLGPMSERLLSELTLTPLDLDQFPLGHVKTVDLAYASEVHLLRGMFEDANHWQLFVPVEVNWRNHVREHWLSSSLVIPKWSTEKPFFLKQSVVHGMLYFNKPQTRNNRKIYSFGLYKMLSSIQNEIEVTNVGSFALDTLRIEKGIPEFGSEIGRLTKPLDIGGENYTDIDKDANYLGQDAVQKQTEEKSSMSLVTLKLHDVEDNNWAWGGEPIRVGTETVGNLCSVAYSFETNSLIGLSPLNLEKIFKEEPITVEVAGVLYSASVMR